MKKRRVKRKFNFLKFFIFVLIVSLITITIYTLFKIKTKNIIILNSKYYSDEMIIETANIENYPKFIMLSKSKIKKKLQQLELIEEVEIKKKLDFTLEITIKEKKILYYIRSNNKYRLSDGKTYELEKIIGYPTLINYVPEDIEEDFYNKFKNIDIDIITLISEIEYSKTSYDKERFKLYMNDGNEVYITIDKIDKLNKYKSIVKKLDNKKGILYLDSGNYLEIKEK